MKKFKKILAAALVAFTVSAFVFTACTPTVPADEETTEQSEEKTSETQKTEENTKEETPEAKTFKVTFDKADGSTDAISTKTVKENEKAAKPADPERTGYSFEGWFAKDSADAFNFDTAITADLTLTAKWKAVEYTITYTLAEGETNNSANPSSYTIESDDITLSAPTGTEAKPTFVAWHKDTLEGASVTVIKKGSTGNLVLAAEFTDKATFNVIYYNGDTVLETVSVVEGGKIENKTLTVEGYAFEGWYSDAEFTTAINFDTAAVTAETKVYGKYTKLAVYKVTVNGTEQSVYAGQKAVKPADPEKEGFTFGGWYSDEACTISFDFETVITADTVVYAKWIKAASPVKEGYFRFVSTSDAAKAGSVMLVLNYESSTLDKASVLSDVDIEYMVNDGEVQHFKNNINIDKNLYGSDYQAKVDILPAVKILKDDAVYIKITAKIDVEAAAAIIQGNLIDTDVSVEYWKEMCEGSEQKQILSGITYEAPAAGSENILFEGSWSKDWETKTFDKAKFANVNESTVISMEVSKDTDRLVDSTDTVNPYKECYAIIQLLKCDGTSGKFGSGTATGATITSTPQLESMFQDTDTNTKFYTVTYKPTEEEWTNIKQNGLGIQAHGTMFRKIELK